MKRIIWMILDSVGMGEMPDAALFGDKGSNTIGNIVKQVGKLCVPNMEKLGLGNITGMQGIPPCKKPLGSYARMAELSNGKDTTIGHWEMIGIHSPNRFPTYPNGFPEELIQTFIKENHLPGILGNSTASGTEIIKRLGEEHRKTRKPIVYTSADSVFQIACHEEVYSIEELYKLCRSARNMLQGEHAVARVIARPFIGQEGEYTRTANRRDFSLMPPEPNLLVNMKESGLAVVGIGKIEDIFAGKGITRAIHTKDNMDGIDRTLQAMKEVETGLIFTNLVEFDSKWGHRNDVLGYAKGLEEFDKRLEEIIKNMNKEDLLIINADHGCDPTTKSTDHSREYVPLLLYGEKVAAGVDLGTRTTFADVGATIAEIYQLPPLNIGTGFLAQIKGE